MTRARHAAVAAALLAVWACMSASPAEACTCAVRELADQVATASTVFEGTVTSTTETSATFDVIRVYKGNNPRATPVGNGGLGSSCAIPFIEGRTYVVFAALQNSTLSTDLCSGTTDDLSVADRLSVNAGPTGSPETGPPVVRIVVVGRRTAPIVAAGMLAALVAGALLLALRALGKRPRPVA